MKQLKIKQIPLSDLDDEMDGWPRFRHALGDKAMAHLRRSIDRVGLTTPPIVWQIPSTERHLILDGCRRLAVLRERDPDQHVFCAVYPANKTADEARELSILARLQSGPPEHLNHGDEILGVVWLWEQERLGKQVKLAGWLGRRQGWVSQAAMLVERLAPGSMLALREDRLSRKAALEMVTRDASGKFPEGDAAQRRWRDVNLLSRRKPGRPKEWRRVKRAALEGEPPGK